MPNPVASPGDTGRLRLRSEHRFRGRLAHLGLRSHSRVQCSRSISPALRSRSEARSRIYAAVFLSTASIGFTLRVGQLDAYGRALLLSDGSPRRSRRDTCLPRVLLSLSWWHDRRDDARGRGSRRRSHRATRKESGTGHQFGEHVHAREPLAEIHESRARSRSHRQGTAFAAPSHDNVIVGTAVTPNSFDVYIFNASGVQIARAFAWSFEGV